MKKKPTVKKPTAKKSLVIALTDGQCDKGVTAFTDGLQAEESRLIFYKSIKPRVPLEKVALARDSFITIAIATYDARNKLEGKLIEELANPTLKNSAKLEGCKLTMKKVKDGINTMVKREMANYRRWLSTGVVDQRKAPKKRGAGGKVTGNQKKQGNPPVSQTRDDVSYNDAVTKGVEELAGISALENIETSYERDVYHFAPRLAFYQAIDKPDLHQQAMINVCTQALDIARASCKHAAKTLKVVNRKYGKDAMLLSVLW